MLRKLHLGKPTKSCVDKCIDMGGHHCAEECYDSCVDRCIDMGGHHCAEECADGAGGGMLEISFKWYGTFVYFIQATLVYSWNQSLLSSGCTKVDRPCNPKRHPTSSQCCKGLYCQAYGPNINPGGRCQYPRIQPEPRILSTHRGTKSK